MLSIEISISNPKKSLQRIIILIALILIAKNSHAMDQIAKSVDRAYELSLVARLKEYTHSILPQAIIDELEKLATATAVEALPMDKATF